VLIWQRLQLRFERINAESLEKYCGCSYDFHRKLIAGGPDERICGVFPAGRKRPKGVA
jgi:hypothetical protein